jgi:putative MATE family efflux protein
MLYVGSFVMVAMVTQFFVGAADTIMCGFLPDIELATASQAALALGMPLFWWVGGFFAAISYGTQALVARRFGAGDDEKAGQVLFNSLVVAVIAGVLGSAIGWFTAEPMVGFFAESSVEQRELAITYAKIRALGIGGVVVAFSFKAFFDGLGRTHVHLIAALFMNACNIGLNYALIFGVPALGIPGMEIAGAALASTIASYVGAVIMIAVSLVPKYRKRFHFYRLSNWSKPVAAEVVRLMIPSGSASVFLMTGFLLVVKFVGMLDAADTSRPANVYAAATMALFYCVGSMAMPAIAFGTATATALSQSIGAGKMNLAARYGWEAARIAALAAIGVAALYWMFPEQVLALFAPRDTAVQAIGVLPLRIMATILPLVVVGLVLAQALYGAGANLYVMGVEATLHAGVLVPLSYLFGPYLGWGLTGVFIAAACYGGGLGVLMLAKFASKGWRQIQL